MPTQQPDVISCDASFVGRPGAVLRAAAQVTVVTMFATVTVLTRGVPPRDFAPARAGLIPSSRRYRSGTARGGRIRRAGTSAQRFLQRG